MDSIISEITQIIDRDFNYNDEPASAEIWKSPAPNLRYGMTMIVKQVEERITKNNERLSSIIFKLVETRPKIPKPTEA